MADRQTATAAPTVPSALPLVALLLGAMAMGISPIFVRLADVGPFASAFWRVAGALPLLWLWAASESRRAGKPLSATLQFDRAIVAAGLIFAADLIFWHLAIVNTTVANATFLALMAPVWVVLGSGLFISERVGREVVFGLMLCLAGAAALVGTSVSFAPDNLLGDVFGIITSIFFGAYFLAVRVARRRARTGQIVFLSSLITAAILLPVALVTEGGILPGSAGGAAALAGLALISHFGGQGLLTFALGHLPAAYSAVVVLIEAPAAAAFGWMILGEAMSLLQAAGSLLILLGIYAARPRRPGN